MRIGIFLGLILTLGLFVFGTTAGPAAAETVPDCIASDETPEGETLAWWNRRNATEQRLMQELPCEQRYITAVCIFLYDPDVIECTNRGVARFKADRHCAAQGHEMLSEAEATCKAEFEANHPPTFTN